jgi:HD-GYP domain-containing protein (c-di-GMP phosphodiesterase class II)
MIEGIDFLEDARSGIRHQQERFDGRGRPDGLTGPDIPVAARIVAVVTAVEDLSASSPVPGMAVGQLLQPLERDPGRFDPGVVSATRAAMEKHGWQAAVTSGAGT